MASTRLSRTNGTSTNQKKGTFSAWVKRSSTQAGQGMISGYVDSNNYSVIYFDSSDRLAYLEQQSGSTESFVRTTRLFRDTNAWYHIVVALDATQSTSSDRVKLYVNGSQETVLSSTNYPSDTNLKLLSNSTPLKVGEDTTGSPNYFNGMMAHVHYVDGTAYTPTTFGQTDATTGIWKPKTGPSVTYGTNGFFLKFDNSANMGLDSSDQSNNLTTTGTIIQTKDTPSNVFSTLNPLVNIGTTSRTIANVATTFNTSTTAWANLLSTLTFSKGKYYVEVKIDTVQSSNGYGGFGITDATESTTANDSIGNVSSKSAGVTFDHRSGQSKLRSAGSAVTSNIGNFSNGDILGLAVDMDNKALYVHLNGTYYQISSVTGVPTSGASKTGAITIPATCEDCVFFCASYTSDAKSSFNFGNGYFGTTAVTSAQSPDGGEGIFEYDVPAGYRALCTKSLNATEYS